ncbi:radical SAM protein [Butyrivibrio sp. INlla16]|uniref:radical SAM protein n=1 Tax=Butyrivibrio sp. INlla16 TaxID=1520807 RepID=UPI00088E5E71|nr:radical SAM protein [Butyrivibrio sp. INlla16]SDB60278.1 4Fe-4S single cluster domain-containing protein [Butyrivibrio sp. INlla16]
MPCYYDFYEASDNGEIVNESDVLNVLKSFSTRIIWGAGNLGQVIGKALLDRDIEIDSYWDARYESVKSCNGITVSEPLELEDARNSLIIFCITNAFVIPKLYQKLDEADINYIDGTRIYEAILCPSSVEDFKACECYKRKECNVATCKRQSNIAFRLFGNTEKVFINTLDVYLTQKCSLKCKYCYIYENSYPPEKKVNFDKERILKDLDLVCDAASFIKRLVPFGGEPFLHPDIAEIIERMAEKKNVGTIDIISNGIFNQPDEVLKRLKFENVKINISNYNQALPEEMIKRREENIRKMAELGLNVVVHNDTPEWRKPGALTNNGLSDDELIAKKRCCANFCEIGENEKDTTETMVVKNGKFFTCQHCDTMYNLGVVDDPEDYIELDGSIIGIELAKEIKKLVNKPYYDACRYCNPSIELVEVAGEQGVDERYAVKKEV